MSNSKIIFEGKSFCFTGEMADIRRSDAEQEVKERRGYPSKSVNRQLDYLVVGSIPNPGWKFEKYGNKINDATKLRKENGKPKILNETEFIDALIRIESKSIGAIEEKMLLIRFNFLCKDNDSLISSADLIVQKLISRHNLFYTKRIYDVSGLVYLFDLQGNFSDEEVLKVEYRLFKHLKVTDLTSETINDAKNFLQSIGATTTNFSCSEYIGGTSIFMRLLEELPSNLRL